MIKFNTKNKFMPYLVFDSIGIPDTSEEILDMSVRVMTASEYAQNMLKIEGYNADVLWHGVEFDKYKPVNNFIKKTLREEWKLPENKDIFLSIGRNFLRKQPERLLTAIAKYNKAYPDNNSFFVMHYSDVTKFGHDLMLFKDRLSDVYECSMENVYFTEDHKLGEGLSEEKLIELYQLSDFYITASSGEGFGLPIVEAMACKKVVIAPDNTTHSYFLDDTRGILAKNNGHYHPGFGLVQLLVDDDNLAECIHNATLMTTDEKIAMTNKAYDYVKINCDWDKITDQLKQIITEVNKNGK